jgi:F420H(2)-dependent quinone reductase
MAKTQITLTTTGWRSGKPRPVTLYAFDDGEDLVVVASKGGAATDPDWAGNLRSEPRATVHKGRVTTEVRAREVDGDERDRLWGLVTAAFPLYSSYQRKTTRRIPLFVLAPTGDVPGPS